jgi:hypothetical protein
MLTWRRQAIARCKLPRLARSGGEHLSSGTTYHLPMISKTQRTPNVDAGIGSIRSDARGFARLGLIHRELSEFSAAQVTIDLSKMDWFDGHMAAPLKIVLRRAEARGNSVIFSGLKPKVEAVLRKNRFLAGRMQDYHQTTMPLTEFDLTQGIDFAHYARKYLARPEMPRMTQALRGKFFEGYQRGLP